MTIPDEPNEPPAPDLGIPDELIKLFEGAWLDAVARYDHHYMHHALAAVLSRHEQMMRESERAAIAKGVKHYFASVEDSLYDDVLTLCGRIERGEYSGRTRTGEIGRACADPCARQLGFGVRP